MSFVSYWHYRKRLFKFTEIISISGNRTDFFTPYKKGGQHKLICVTEFLPSLASFLDTVSRDNETLEITSVTKQCSGIARSELFSRSWWRTADRHLFPSFNHFMKDRINSLFKRKKELRNKKLYSYFQFSLLWTILLIILLSFFLLFWWEVFLFGLCFPRILNLAKREGINYLLSAVFFPPLLRSLSLCLSLWLRCLSVIHPSLPGWLCAPRSN